MKLLDKIADWIVAKPYRYWIAHWLLNVIIFFSACVTVAGLFVLITK